VTELSPRSKVGSRVPPSRRRPIWVTIAVAGLIAIGVVVAVSVFAPLKVTAVYAYPQPARIPACAPSVKVLGSIFINNPGGNVSYEWIRPDGTISRAATLFFPKGQAVEHVQMTWVFPQSENGMQVTATLKVLSPNTMSASAKLFYYCF
jgi:hypothetical protein